MKIIAILLRPLRRIVRPNLPGVPFILLSLSLAACRSTVAPAAIPPIPPVAEANQTAAATNSAAAEIRRTLPILFIVGDSTVHNDGPGLLGWGDVLGRYFDPQKIIVENHAKPGRSSRTFQTQGWWAQVLAAARPGDFVLIQMGHNDGQPLDDTNRARGTLAGLGDESREIYNAIRHQPERVHTYGWYMRQYIADARARGITPVICSPVPRMPRQPPQASDVDRYVAWSAQVAADQKVSFINLNQIILGHYTRRTSDQIKTNYFTPQDNTHSSPAGAQLNAACVVAGLRTLTNCPLDDYLLEKPGLPVPD